MSNVSVSWDLPSSRGECKTLFEKMSESISNHGWDSIKNAPVSVRCGCVVSVFSDDKWDWSHYEKSAASLSKGGADSGFLNFAAIKNERIKNEVKLLVYGWMFFVSGRYGRDVSTGYIGSRVTSLSFVTKFLIQSDKNTLSSLSEVNTWNSFTHYVKSQDKSYTFCSQIATSLKAIEIISSELPFYFSFVEKKPTAWARKNAKLGTESNQTLAIPMRVAEMVYGKAVDIIEEAYHHVDVIEDSFMREWNLYCQGRDIVNGMIERGDLPKPRSKKALTKLIWKHAPKRRYEVVNAAMSSTGWGAKNIYSGTWLTRKQMELQTAAFICIAGFTGMRDSELFGLNANSFVHTDIGGLPIDLVRSIHEKLTKGGKVEEWVACPIVGKAIRVAVAVTKHMREQWKKESAVLSESGHNHESEVANIVSESLWLIQHDKNELPNYKTSSGINERLRLFVKECGEEALVTRQDLDEVKRQTPHSMQKINEKISVGEPWPLAKHQMRRTFAVFVVKNKLGHPIALKQQFKHIHLKMTEWYANGAMQARVRDIKQDESLNKLIADVLVDQTTGVIVDAANGQASGGFAEAIQGEVTVYGSWDSVYALVKQGRLSLSGTAHGYCKNGYQCDMDGVINPSFCVPCENSLITEDKIKWWREKRERLINYLSGTSPSRHELSHFLTQIRAAEKVMSDAGEIFEKYQAGIEVMEV